MFMHKKSVNYVFSMKHSYVAFSNLEHVISQYIWISPNFEVHMNSNSMIPTYEYI